MIHPNLASKIGTTTGRLAWGGGVGGTAHLHSRDHALNSANYSTVRRGARRWMHVRWNHKPPMS